MASQARTRFASAHWLPAISGSAGGSSVARWLRRPRLQNDALHRRRRPLPQARLAVVHGKSYEHHVGPIPEHVRPRPMGATLAARSSHCCCDLIELDGRIPCTKPAHHRVAPRPARNAASQESENISRGNYNCGTPPTIGKCAEAAKKPATARRRYAAQPAGSMPRSPLAVRQGTGSPAWTRRQERMPCTTSPWTSVRRKSRPW